MFAAADMMEDDIPPPPEEMVWDDDFGLHLGMCPSRDDLTTRQSCLTASTPFMIPHLCPRPFHDLYVLHAH